MFPHRSVSRAMLEAVSDPILYPSLTVSLAALEKHPQAICHALSSLTSLREFRLVRGDGRDMSAASIGSHQGFRVPASLFAMLGTACRSLRSLELHADNATIEDDSLCRLLKANGLRLRRLLVHNCFSLTDGVLTAVAADKLAELELCWCGSLTDTGVAALLARTPHLERLTLNNDFRLTDDVLYALASSLLANNTGNGCNPVLTSLNLNFLSNISDKGLKAVLGAGGGRSLTRVSLRYTGITDQSLYRLAASCPHLAELDLKLCRLISDKGVQAVCEQRGHNLRLVNLGR